jgi:hypothetical protein
MNTSRSLSVANDDPAPAAGECVSAPTRELAQRLSGTVEVQLLWQPEIDRVHLSVRDLATGAGFDIAVPRANAIDAFYHPYAYAARRKNSYQVGRAETAILDG